MFKKIIYYLAYLMKIYIRLSPLKLGKGLLKQIIAFILSKFYHELTVVSEDQRKFSLKLPEDKSRLTIFSTGYCEKNLTILFQKIIRSDDIIFDVGANIGWYTTLFAGKGKECHAFEPNPKIFDRLINNCKLNNVDEKCRFNNVAVGNKDGIVSFYSFKELDHGLSSLSDFNRNDKEEIKVPITTLSTYIKKNCIKKVDLIKIDVEGSEYDILTGIEDLLKKGFSPIFIFELNNETSKAFNYSPSDILVRLKQYNYAFYLVRNKLIKLNNLHAYKNGDEVLCLKPEVHKDRFKLILPEWTNL
ncbi:MAG: FkbM family methyltransferase [Candidatus Cloacimonadales bacterium]|nr:FkbM family methyltransferase [Candidatus Cloacimonadales bacterium]